MVKVRDSMHDEISGCFGEFYPDSPKNSRKLSSDNNKKSSSSGEEKPSHQERSPYWKVDPNN